MSIHLMLMEKRGRGVRNSEVERDRRFGEKEESRGEGYRLGSYCIALLELMVQHINDGNNDRKAALHGMVWVDR